MRIVTLLPSATEIVFALGGGGDLVGVTHECDHPAAARDLPAVTEDLLAPGLTPAEIDAAVSSSVADAHTIYRLDADRLRAVNPDVVISQELCEVCAVATPAVVAAVCTLPGEARVVSSDPTDLDGLWATIREIGQAIGSATADDLVSRLQARIESVRHAVAGLERPRVAVLEWPDPPFVAGHWVPQMVEIAGGTNIVGRTGAKSVRVPWSDLAGSGPDIVVLAFCGFDIERTITHFADIAPTAEWQAFAGDARVVAVDGSAYFSRPGPRLVDGVEHLAFAFHGIERPPAAAHVAEHVDGIWERADR